MHRVRLLRSGSLLGLLAILLATFAPTVSQALAAHRLGNMLATYSTYCSAETGSVSSAHKESPARPATTHDQICPYCSLFVHAPVLPGSPVAFAVLPAVAHRLVMGAPLAVRANAVHTVAQSRAPPAFS